MSWLIKLIRRLFSFNIFSDHPRSMHVAVPFVWTSLCFTATLLFPLKRSRWLWATDHCTTAGKRRGKFLVREINNKFHDLHLTGWENKISTIIGCTTEFHKQCNHRAKPKLSIQLSIHVYSFVSLCTVISTYSLLNAWRFLNNPLGRDFSLLWWRYLTKSII